MSSRTPNRVHVLGAGSIGLLLAHRLAEVVPVTLVSRPGSPPTDVTVRLRDAEGSRIVDLRREPADRVSSPVEGLVVCTKAQDALPALECMAPVLRSGVSLLLMQNGMGSQQAVAKRFAGLSVYAASSTEGAYREATGEVVHAGRGSSRIGRLIGPEAHWVGLLRAAGLDAQPAEPIERYLADKLRVNAVINPLTVIHDCRNGGLLEIPEAREWMARLGREADDVLAAAGHAFSDTAEARSVAVARATANNVSSMLQDARAGRPLEIDYINGYLVQLADRHGVSAPSHRAVREMLERVLASRL